MIDFHCHLDLYPDAQAVAKECIARKMVILSVTNTPSAWDGTSALGKPDQQIFTALGLHPQIAHQRYGELGMLKELIGKTRFMGEVGLDGAPEYRPHWEKQARVFETALQVATQAGGRILTIHSRRAATEVVDLLARYPSAGTFVLHWYSGNYRDLLRAIDFGCWFSVGPAMMAGKNGRAIMERIPRNRILTESDGPFAQVDGRPAKPWDVDRAEAALGDIWRISASEAREAVQDNLMSLLKENGIRPEMTSLH